MGKLAKEDYEAWRLGTFRIWNSDLNLSQSKTCFAPSRTMQEGRPPTEWDCLRFMGKKSEKTVEVQPIGKPGIEQAHATHFVTPRENGVPCHDRTVNG